MTPYCSRGRHRARQMKLHPNSDSCMSAHQGKPAVVKCGTAPQESHLQISSTQICLLANCHLHPGELISALCGPTDISNPRWWEQDNNMKQLLTGSLPNMGSFSGLQSRKAILVRDFGCESNTSVPSDLSFMLNFFLK